MADESPNQHAIAAVSNEGNEEIRPKIYKLDVDCVQEMFDWLTIRDIYSVGETCIRMHRIGVDYFQTYLTGLYMAYHREIFNYLGNDMNGFKKIIQKLIIVSPVDNDGYRFIGLHCKSLKNISFAFLTLNMSKIKQLNPILSKIESVGFTGNNFQDEFYEGFLQFCPNLNILTITYSARGSNKVIGTSNEWLLRSYPALKHLLIHSLGDNEIPELGTFFEQNPGLQTFFIDDGIFLRNIGAILQAENNLQMLTLKIDSIDIDMIIDTICDLLNQLHDRRFYQVLSLRLSNAGQQTIDRISLTRGLEHLHLFLDTKRINLNSLTNLKKLELSCKHENLQFSVESDVFIIDLKSAAEHLVNLERLHLRIYRPEMIEPFIQYSKKLKTIRMEYLKNVAFINLSALNKKREILNGAKKVTIYLADEAFVATKWSNEATDFKTIELKRIESKDWNTPHPF